MLLSTQTPNLIELMMLATSACILVGVLIALLIARWIVHLRSLQHAIASSFAPIDVQVMRCVDLLREFLQDPDQQDLGLNDQGKSLREVHARLRNASRQAALCPTNAQEIAELKRAIDEFRAVFEPELSQRASVLRLKSAIHITSELNAAWQRLHGVQGPFRDAVANYNRALSHPLGRFVATLLRLTPARSLDD